MFPSGQEALLKAAAGNHDTTYYTPLADYYFDQGASVGDVVQRTGYNPQYVQSHYNRRTGQSPQNDGVALAARTDSTAAGTGRSGSGGSTGSSANQQDLQYLNDQEGRTRKLFDYTKNALNNGLTNLGDSYNRERSSANQQRSRALENFQVQREDTTRGKQKALGQVDTNARTLSDSLRRILGLASGSGSSAFQLAAPNAVSRQASQQRTGVQETFGRNFRDLEVSEGRAKTDFDSLLENLTRQRNDKESQLRQGVLEQEQGINETLADIARQRALLQGGGYSQVQSAQAPFTNAIDSRQSQIDALFGQFRNPQLSVDPVSVQAPNLRDYVTDRAKINVQNQGGGQYAPYRQFLRNDEEEER